ncbi:MAG: glutathione S-transferase family protein [Myxococcales bacterium]|nr:glutathione S-transferase family protein [Myxococcales bacterium]
MLTVYGLKRSRSTRALWALEEAGLPYDFRRLDARAGEHRQPDFLALNPGGKVPVLVDGDFVLSESGAIVTWVAEQVPALGLVPAAGTRARALYDQWLHFALTELEQPLWVAAKHTFVLPEKLRVPAVIPVCAKEFGRAAQVLAQGLGDRPFLLGDAFTMADLVVGHTLAWAVRQQGLPLDAPAVAAYAERLWARPAFARAEAREAA